MNRYDDALARHLFDLMGRFGAGGWDGLPDDERDHWRRLAGSCRPVLAKALREDEGAVEAMARAIEAVEREPNDIIAWRAIRALADYLERDA